MKFTSTLIKGKLIKRYKRFFTDVKISNEIVTAHCPNTGSMKGLLDEGNDVYISKNDDPKRVIPTWLSRQEGDKRHFRLKFAQRSLALTPKGEDRLTVDLDVDQVEVFEYLKSQVLSGAYDKSIEVISAEIRKGYSK